MRPVTGAYCDYPYRPTRCTAPAGSSFTLAFLPTDLPAIGYGGIKTYVVYEGLGYTPSASPATEIVWPEKTGLNVRYPQPINGHEGWVSHTELSQGVGGLASHYDGIVVQITLSCPPADRWYRLVQLPFDTFSFPDGAALLVQPVLFEVPVDGELYIHCDPSFGPVGGNAAIPQATGTQRSPVDVLRIAIPTAVTLGVAVWFLARPRKSRG